MSLKKLQAWCNNNNFKKYNAIQIFEWLYRHGIMDAQLMLNIKKDLRQLLYKNFEFKTLNIKRKISSETQATVKFLFETLDNKFPIIMKTLEGSKGVGVLFIESERQIESLVQLLYSQNENIDLLIQEYIKTDGDIRVIVLGGKIIASMKRDIVEGDFRSNVSQGANVREYKLTELEVEQCLLAAKAINGSWAAIDFIASNTSFFTKVIDLIVSSLS